MDTIRAFSPPKLGHFFLIFEKGQGRPPPLPPLVTRLQAYCKHIIRLKSKNHNYTETDSKTTNTIRLVTC